MVETDIFSDIYRYLFIVGRGQITHRVVESKTRQTTSSYSSKYTPPTVEHQHRHSK